MSNFFDIKKIGLVAVLAVLLAVAAVAQPLGSHIFAQESSTAPVLSVSKVTKTYTSNGIPHEGTFLRFEWTTERTDLSPDGIYGRDVGSTDEMVRVSGIMGDDDSEVQGETIRI